MIRREQSPRSWIVKLISKEGGGGSCIDLHKTQVHRAAAIRRHRHRQSTAKVVLLKMVKSSRACFRISRLLAEPARVPRYYGHSFEPLASAAAAVSCARITPVSLKRKGVSYYPRRYAAIVLQGDYYMWYPNMEDAADVLPRNRRPHPRNAAREGRVTRVGGWYSTVGGCAGHPRPLHSSPFFSSLDMTLV